jgi:hypothetical protein
LYYEELIGRAREAVAKAEKAIRRAREDFQSLLRHTREIKSDTKYDAAAELLGKEPEWTAVRLLYAHQ